MSAAKLLPLALVLAAALPAPGTAQVAVTNVQSSPQPGKPPKFAVADFGKYLQPGEAPTGTVEPLARAAAAGMANAAVLDFEPASGFPEANVAVEDDGAVARVPGLKFVNPAVLAAKVKSVAVASAQPITIGLDWRVVDAKAGTLGEHGDADARGVFLVSDRAAADAVPSGRQGIAWVPAQGGLNPAGVLFTPSAPLRGFCFAANNQHEDYTVAVYAFDAAGKKLFSYARGFPKGMSISLGFLSTQANIGSVWVGQRYPHDGTVLDDVVLVPSPAP